MYTRNIMVGLLSVMNMVTAAQENIAVNEILPTSALASKVEQYVNSYAQTGDFASCIAISKSDEIIYSDCFGKANVTFGIKNTIDHKFKIGSISKQFTAIAILKLQEKGLLNINDPLTLYYPGIAQFQNTTIEHLLIHKAGIVDIYDVDNFNTLSCKKTTSDELVEMILQEALRFPSGTSYSYSNGGYLILADIIEKASRTTYAEFLKKEIFDPLNMQHTGHAMDNEIILNLAVGYDPKGYSSFEKAALVSNELMQGSGSIFSTITDIFIWIEMLKNRSFLSQNSYDQFFHNYGNNYGLGISVYRYFDQHVFGHDGRMSGYIADYLSYKESEISIVILGNVQTGVSDFFRHDLAAIVFQKQYTSNAKEVAPLSTLPKPVESYVESYSFGPNFVVHVEHINGVLKARANEGSYSELVPLANGQFFSRVLYAHIQFIENDLGELHEMRWINNNGNSFSGFRMD